MANVRTGWLQPLGKVRKFIPALRILWFTHLKLADYDLVISSSGAEAKGIRVPETTVHINYCHAPTHYYWSRYDQYMKQPGFPVGLNWLARIGLRLLVGPLRKWDYKAAQRPDYMIANSTLHPVADPGVLRPGAAPSSTRPSIWSASGNRTIGNCRDAASWWPGGRRRTSGSTWPSKPATGWRSCLPSPATGPDHARLRKLGGHDITFLGKVSDEVMEHELASAQAFIFPGTDDFGITPIESHGIRQRPSSPTKPAARSTIYCLGNPASSSSSPPPSRSKKCCGRSSRSATAGRPSPVFAERFSRDHFKRKVTRFIQAALTEISSRISAVYCSAALSQP
ncbi:MAG: hypothetical protein WDN27_01980 [Candidatus Saccharibacteria bacterium]